MNDEIRRTFRQMVALVIIGMGCTFIFGAALIWAVSHGYLLP